MTKPKILLGYIATRNIWPAFNAAQQFQSEYLYNPVGFDKVLVTDTDEVVPTFTCVKCSNLWVNGLFCQNAGRNSILAFGISGGFDALVILDADVMLTEAPRTAFDGSFSCCHMYWSTEEEINAGCFNLEDRLRWTSSGDFILNRKDFLHNRFCEDYLGYGYDDADFYYNVLQPSGVKPEHWTTRAEHWTTRAVHYWHPRRPIPPEVEERNRVLYFKRGGRLK